MQVKRREYLEDNNFMQENLKYEGDFSKEFKIL